MELLVLSLDKIDEGVRYRKDYGEKEMEDLISSISREGLIQPLAVMEQEDGRYRLLAGGRRYEAISRMGWEEVPCRIFTSIGELQQRSIELHENLTRKNLDFKEELALKKEIHELKVAEYGVQKSTNPDPNATGWTQARTAGMFGESANNLGRDLQLANVIDVVPGLKDAKNKSEAHKLYKKYQKMAENSVLAAAVAQQSKETPVAKQQQKLVDSYIIGDVFTKLPSLPSNAFDLIEIDPPYGIDLEEKRKNEVKGLSTLSYNEVEAKEYKVFLARLFEQCYRLLSNSGWLICWFGPDPWYDVVRDELKAAGFKLAGIPAAWVKPSGQTMNPKSRLGNSYELFFYCSKGVAELNKQGRANTFCYKLVSPDRKIHPTERPIEMMEDIIETFCLPGSNILVPFGGSGNTVLAANNKQMKAVCYDLSQEYKDAYTLRVHASTPGTYKSYS